MLWPNSSPEEIPAGLVGEWIQRSSDPAAYSDRVGYRTTEPRLIVVRPPAPNGASLLILPGGGYFLTTLDKEGVDIARVFAEAGVTCFVLEYRLPGDGWRAGPLTPLQDAQRAMRLVRHRAAELGLDPERIALLGSSAGGHLAGLLASGYPDAYSPVDDADAHTVRPRLTILNYPAATLREPYGHARCRKELAGDHPSAEMIEALSLEQRDWSGAAPVCLFHAIDDADVVVENTTGLLATLRRDGVPAEAHLFQKGGHGFAIRLCEGLPARRWPEIAVVFGSDHGWL